MAKDGVSLIEQVEEKTINNFNIAPKQVGDFAIAPDTTNIQVIQAIDGALITKDFIASAMVEEGNVVSDLTQDVLKMVVVNRYEEQPPAIAFINGFEIRCYSFLCRT